MKMKNKNWKAIHEETSKWARWIALYEAINLIADKCEEKGVPFEKIVFKPLEIRDYIASTEDIIARKILNQEYNIDVSFEEVKSEKEDYQFV